MFREPRKPKENEMEELTDIEMMIFENIPERLEYFNSILTTSIYEINDYIDVFLPDFDRNNAEREEVLKENKFRLFKLECEFYQKKCNLIQEMIAHIKTQDSAKKLKNNFKSSIAFSNETILKNMLDIYNDAPTLNKKINYITQCMEHVEKEINDTIDGLNKLVSDLVKEKMKNRFYEAPARLFNEKDATTHGTFRLHRTNLYEKYEVVVPLYEFNDLIANKKKELEDRKDLCFLLDVLKKEIDLKNHKIGYDKNKSIDKYKIKLADIISSWKGNVESSQKKRQKKEELTKSQELPKKPESIITHHPLASSEQLKKTERDISPLPELPEFDDSPENLINTKQPKKNDLLKQKSKKEKKPFKMLTKSQKMKKHSEASELSENNSLPSSQKVKKKSIRDHLSQLKLRTSRDWEVSPKPRKSEKSEQSESEDSEQLRSRKGKKSVDSKLNRPGSLKKHKSRRDSTRSNESSEVFGQSEASEVSQSSLIPTQPNIPKNTKQNVERFQVSDTLGVLLFSEQKTGVQRFGSPELKSVRPTREKKNEVGTRSELFHDKEIESFIDELTKYDVIDFSLTKKPTPGIPIPPKK